MLKDIIDYLYLYEQTAEIPWNILIKRFSLKLKDGDGNIIPFDDAIVYVLFRKLLEQNIIFTAANRNLYFAVLLQVLDMISRMDTTPTKTTITLLLLLFDLSPGIEYVRKSITDKTFEKIKNHIHIDTGLSDKEIKIKISQLTGLKDPKSLRKYLKKYREWEK